MKATCKLCGGEYERPDKPFDRRASTFSFVFSAPDPEKPGNVREVMYTVGMCNPCGERIGLKFAHDTILIEKFKRAVDDLVTEVLAQKR